MLDITTTCAFITTTAQDKMASKPEVEEPEAVVYWKGVADPHMSDCGSADVNTLMFWIVSVLAKIGKIDLLTRLHEAVMTARAEREKSLSAATKKDAEELFYRQVLSAYSKARDIAKAVEAELKEEKNKAHYFAWWLYSGLTGEVQFLQIEIHMKK